MVLNLLMVSSIVIMHLFLKCNGLNLETLSPENEKGETVEFRKDIFLLILLSSAKTHVLMSYCTLIEM